MSTPVPLAQLVNFTDGSDDDAFDLQSMRCFSIAMIDAHLNTADAMNNALLRQARLPPSRPRFADFFNACWHWRALRHFAPRRDACKAAAMLWHFVD